MASIRESMTLRREGLERNIARTQGQISRADSKGLKDVAHQKRRKLHNLELRLSSLDADIAAGRVRLCFGSRKLWQMQFNLEANGYTSHEGWVRDWRESRSNELFVMGSRDETSGCQLCVATVAEDGSLTVVKKVDFGRNDLGGVVKRVYSRSSLPGVGRWPGMTPLSWHNGSPLRATA